MEKLIDAGQDPGELHDRATLRELAGELVAFCRRARDEEDILFAWTI
jgi:hypothetical protein